MNVLPDGYFSFTENDKETWQNIQQWFNKLSSNYGVSQANQPNLDSFEIINKHGWYIVWQSLNIKKGNLSFNLLIANYLYDANRDKNIAPSDITNGNYYFLGYLNLRENFGRAYIRPETVSDKIQELFQPIEIDFKEHKKFSWKYFTVATNKDKFKRIVLNKPKITEVLTDNLGTYIEFNTNKCLFMNFKTVSEDNLLYTLKLGLELDCALNEKSF